MTISITATVQQAAKVAPGTVAEIQNSWMYQDLKVVVSAIKVDTQNPSKNRILECQVTGSVNPGEVINVALGQKSVNYDMVVPNSAIREDAKGKFILTVEAKSSPLGNRYKAKRVDVTVIESDDAKSAISGELYGWEWVVTSSTAPIETGQLVRLQE